MSTIGSSELSFVTEVSEAASSAFGSSESPELDCWWTDCRLRVLVGCKIDWIEGALGVVGESG